MEVGDEELPHGLESLMAGMSLPDEVSEQVLVTRVGQVVQAATQVLGVEAAGLLLLDESGVLRLVASTDAQVQALERAQEVLQVGPALDTMRTGKPVPVADLAEVPAYARLWSVLESGTVRAVLSAPVRAEEELVGNLNLVRDRPHPWAQDQVQAAQAYADVLGTLLALAARTRAAEALATGARQRFDLTVGAEDADAVNEPGRGDSSGSPR